VRSTIIRTLQEREWIRVVGHRDVPGKPALFGTTRAFLDYFNLASLDDLPSLAEIRDMGSIEPELDLDQAQNDEAAEEKAEASESTESAETPVESDAEVDAEDLTERTDNGIET